MSKGLSGLVIHMISASPGGSMSEVHYRVADANISGTLSVDNEGEVLCPAALPMKYYVLTTRHVSMKTIFAMVLFTVPMQ